MPIFVMLHVHFTSFTYTEQFLLKIHATVGKIIHIQYKTQMQLCTHVLLILIFAEANICKVILFQCT